MIKLNKISKKYGKRAIFSDFSYDFPDKGFICLVGSSGSGKSTLLNLISGVDNNYSGTIKISKNNKSLPILSALDSTNTPLHLLFTNRSKFTRANFHI